jgi:hypothetical protein
MGIYVMGAIQYKPLVILIFAGSTVMPKCEAASEKYLADAAS